MVIITVPHYTKVTILVYAWVRGRSSRREHKLHDSPDSKGTSALLRTLSEFYFGTLQPNKCRKSTGRGTISKGPIRYSRSIHNMSSLMFIPARRSWVDLTGFFQSLVPQFTDTHLCNRGTDDSKLSSGVNMSGVPSHLVKVVSPW